LQLDERAQLERFDECGGLRQRNFGVDGHKGVILGNA
jgi:hypothetical protein